jgi:hypothetical protein
LTYEAAQRGGWRFDLYLVLPAYGLILAGWLVRLVLALGRGR